MKIISAEQNRILDRETIIRQNISSLQLMERAGEQLFSKIFKDCGASNQYKIICGDGNNGGDGLVLARLLHQTGCDVQVYCNLHSDKKSLENQENLIKLEQIGLTISDISNIENSADSIWIDAIFGTGLNKPLQGKWQNIVEQLNSFSGKKLSIDIPSGMFPDTLNEENDTIYLADKTYTIGQPKLTFFFPETGKYVGDISILDIGLDKESLNELKSKYYYSTFEKVKKIYKPRQKFSHKGTYGHALLIAGSYGKIGAAVIATKSALKSGAGLVSSYIPKSGYFILQNSVPEAMCQVDRCEEYITNFPNIEKFDSIGLGPGLGTSTETRISLKKWLKTYDFEDIQIVLDADALNIISMDKEILNYLPKFSILTPHPKEFERLIGVTKNNLSRLKLAIDFSKKHQIVLVLKDAYTTIISPNGEVYFNSTGNARLSTGGSGDALTGIITGLLAQKYNPIEAAVLGVWIHGKTADNSITLESMESFTATDIPTNLGQVFNLLKK